MNELEILEALYPDGEPLSPTERSSMRANLFSEPLALTAHETLSPPTPRRAMSIAAALVVACGGAGIWLAMDRPADPNQSESPPAANVATTTPSATTTPVTVDVVDRTAPVSPSTAITTTTPTTTSPVNPASHTLLELSDIVAATIDLAFDAIDTETQECLRARGIDSIATPTFPLLAPRVTPNDLPWNMPNQQPSFDGYAKPEDRSFTEVVPPAEGSEAFAALYGRVVGTWFTDDPDPQPGSFVEGPIYDGCFPTAQTQIIGGGDPASAFNLSDAAIRLNNASILFINEVTADPQYQIAVADWAACMRQNGVDASAPEELASRDWGRQRPTADEITTATTDAECRQTSRLLEVGNQLFDDQATSWLAENPDAEDEIRNIALEVSARTTQRAEVPR